MQLFNKYLYKVLLPLLFGIGSVSQANAIVVNFDNIPSVDYSVIPSGYQGFTWSGSLGAGSWLVSNISGPHGSIGAGAHSGANFAWNNGAGTVLTITAATPFDFNSSWIGAGCCGGSLSIQAYLGSTLKYGAIVSPTSSYSEFTFDYLAIDKLVFAPTSSRNFMYDDMVFNATPVPEPNTYALLASGVLLLCHVVRRKQITALTHRRNA